MKTLFRFKLEMMMRVRDFYATLTSVFPADSKAGQLIKELAEFITRQEALSTDQVSGSNSARGVSTSVTLAREAVLDDLAGISRTARALAITTPGLEKKFRLPRKTRDQEVLASARAFLRDAAPLKAQFIALEMPANFLEVLEAHIATFQAALTERHTTQHSKATTIKQMDSMLDHGIAIVHQLDAIMKNKFHNDHAVLLAWKRACRIEKTRSAGSSSQEAPPAEGGPEKTPPEPPKTPPKTSPA